MNGTNAEEKQFLAKLDDIIELVEKTGKKRFSNFLDPYLFHLALSRLHGMSGIKHQAFGGYDGAERNILCVYPDDEECAFSDFPIASIKVTGRDINKLSHRDFLGTLMSIGIKREVVGDIVIDDNYVTIFAVDTMADFIMNQISKVGGVGVRLEAGESMEEFSVSPAFSVREGTVATARIDAVAALGFGISRTAAVDYIKMKKVFLNYRLCESASKEVKEGDLITVRGLGRMTFDCVLGTTKKDRVFIRTKKFV